MLSKAIARNFCVCVSHPGQRVLPHHSPFSTGRGACPTPDREGINEEAVQDVLKQAGRLHCTCTNELLHTLSTLLI